MNKIFKIDLHFLFGREDELLVKAKFIGETLEQNEAPHFANMNPKIADGIVIINAFSDAITAAASRDRHKIIEKNIKKTAVQNLMRTWAGQCITLAANTVDILNLTGFDFYLPSHAGVNVITPQTPKVKQSTLAGSVELRAKSVRGARLYEFRYTTHDPATATDNDYTVVVPSPTRKLIEGLTPGQVYFFEVRANGTHNVSGWSEPCMFRVG